MLWRALTPWSRRIRASCTWGRIWACRCWLFFFPPPGAMKPAPMAGDIGSGRPRAPARPVWNPLPARIRWPVWTLCTERAFCAPWRRPCGPRRESQPRRRTACRSGAAIWTPWAAYYACTAAMMMVMPPIHMTIRLITPCSKPSRMPARAKPPPSSMKSLIRPMTALFSSTEDM